MGELWNDNEDKLIGAEGSLSKKEMLSFEIERKFRVKHLPDNLDMFHHFDVVQGYFPDSEGQNVRLRSAEGKYFRTIKKGQGLIREQKEVEISEKEFQRDWPLTLGVRIEKTRYLIPYHDWLIELDVYGGSLSGLYTVEVEFESEDESKKFISPDWFGEEVTDNPNYTNHNLALRGLPEKSD